MNAVATPPKAVRRGLTEAIKSQTPDWATLLLCLTNDMREVTDALAVIGNKVGPDEPAIGKLIDCAHDDIYRVKRSLDARPLSVATTDAAYEALYKPLAHLQGASAMAKMLEVDIFSGAIDRAATLLDEVHNSLSDQVIGVMLPKPPESGSIPSPTHAPQAPDRHERPALMPADKVNSLGCRVSIVCALLDLLTINLDSEMAEGPRNSGDVMGILQHTDLLLNELNEDISNIGGVLPDDLRWRTFEAKAIVAVARRMTDDDGWGCMGYDAPRLIWHFMAAKDALQRAQKALDGLEPRHD